MRGWAGRTRIPLRAGPDPTPRRGRHGNEGTLRKPRGRSRGPAGSRPASRHHPAPARGIRPATSGGLRSPQSAPSPRAGHRGLRLHLAADRRCSRCPSGHTPAEHPPTPLAKIRILHFHPGPHTASATRVSSMPPEVPPRTDGVPAPAQTRLGTSPRTRPRAGLHRPGEHRSAPPADQDTPTGPCILDHSPEPLPCTHHRSKGHQNDLNNGNKMWRRHK